MQGKPKQPKNGKDDAATAKMRQEIADQQMAKKLASQEMGGDDDMMDEEEESLLGSLGGMKKKRIPAFGFYNDFEDSLAQDVF